MIKYQGYTVELTLFIHDKKAPFDVYMTTSDNDLQTRTTPTITHTKRVQKATSNRTLVIYVCPEGRTYKLLSFESDTVPPLDECTLLFPPPVNNATQISGSPGSRTFTTEILLLPDFDLLKFGNVYYTKPVSRMQRIHNCRKRVCTTNEPKYDLLDFQSFEELEDKVGEEGMAWFWTWYDQFFSVNQAETGLWLLRQGDEDSLAKFRNELRELLERGEKRFKDSIYTPITQ